MIRKKKGFVLLPVVLATFIMGMLGIGLASMYSGTFSTMNAGKAASKAKDFATIEGNYVKLNGYDTASSMTHDWESLSDLVGPDATGWQSKVETSSTATSADGNQVKVMKVAVKKDSDIASRYTYEVPVVQGKDSYTKAEIDAMMSVVNGNFTKVNNRIDAMIEDTNNIKTQINNLYADMDSLNKNLDKLHTLVENYRTSLLNSINGVQGNLDAEIAARKAADASESSARQSADNALNKRCDNIDGKIKDLQGALSNTQERVKSLEGRVSSLEGRTKNLEDRASALESGLDAETKARIAADKSITDELHSVRDNLTEKYKALKTSVDDIGGKVKNMSKDVKANTDNIASINELLKNSFVFNGKHNTGISLAYDATQKKMRAYYNGQEVPLGSQGGVFDVVNEAGSALTAKLTYSVTGGLLLTEFQHAGATYAAPISVTLTGVTLKQLGSTQSLYYQNWKIATRATSSSYNATFKKDGPTFCNGLYDLSNDGIKETLSMHEDEIREWVTTLIHEQDPAVDISNISITY